MAYSSFPHYAQVLLDSFSVKTTAAVQRDEMEDGYVHQAPANSLTRYELSLVYRLQSLADKTAFEAWRRVTLANGALHFEWSDPADPLGQTLRRARIVKGEVSYKPVTNRFDDWQASFTLEYWA